MTKFLIRLEESQKQKAEQFAREVAVKTKKSYTLSSLIRDAVEAYLKNRS